jgi:hypothetical protein
VKALTNSGPAMTPHVRRAVRSLEVRSAPRTFTRRVGAPNPGSAYQSVSEHAGATSIYCGLRDDRKGTAGGARSCQTLRSMGPGAKIIWSRDVGRAEWIGPRLDQSWQNIGSVVPTGYEAYCRIFHPVAAKGDEPPKTWAEVAATNGRIAHPEMQFHKISTPVGTEFFGRYVRGVGLEWGSCPRPIREALVDVLSGETTTRDQCWFCVWDGFGGIDYDGPSDRVSFPLRDYALYGGAIELALEPLDDFSDEASANLWWPDDRAWIVATEIDYSWTYVGGTSALIEKLIRREDLEVMRASPADKPFYGSDTLNEALDAQ